MLLDHRTLFLYRKKKKTTKSNCKHLANCSFAVWCFTFFTTLNGNHRIRSRWKIHLRNFQQKSRTNEKNPKKWRKTQKYWLCLKLIKQCKYNRLDTGFHSATTYFTVYSTSYNLFNLLPFFTDVIPFFGEKMFKLSKMLIPVRVKLAHLWAWHEFLIKYVYIKSNIEITQKFILMVVFHLRALTHIHTYFGGLRWKEDEVLGAIQLLLFVTHNT